MMKLTEIRQQGYKALIDALARISHQIYEIQVQRL
jgi:hypothetical protein